ncbi:formate--tetrahydrofolate ligase [Vibrio cyclitrophicus]|uniref:Formate--tetrahydrofolate ligase n=1 Tax=Vibrio cyclitrophicus ZF270 TaxID=1136176 RepID=A0AAN0LRZ0_9VIBR|nr:formate--tetrahydrofolate ligase [Vibrio cyclitrophicus]OBT00306.1 formate--tetrahydrofolate ligase [Vibrio cyclitrophicus]OEE02821.1 formate--tetrahydrofolate ligase [Vibrio cyclitrophicus ZF270]OEE13000.1 formate--tetrahydrofolate ligase [Vibrio cyclitrophicus ZF205]OEE27739.1 formate--tetrahydrofolate ligase [Vibrio cyclitrophicus ZF170]PME15737.1 formate--tetrahydrofolate ligase [Vibrio cyclitrophicus]|tara:strand:- start:2960 stop:4708 length:1749 start_codon:yes stop_codon:yes gene_type:complete
MLSDIDICRSTPLKNISEVAKHAGLQNNEHQPLGQYKSKVSLTSLERLANQQDGKLVVVTAITPTPLGEGKTVTTIGLAQGLAKINQSAMACIRQPSMGPVFGVKGGAAGGGYSQVAPMEQLNLHLTGDIHAVTAAHNLASAAIDARLYHEQREGLGAFEARSGLKALDIDPNRIVWRRVLDHNDRALRMLTVGKNEAGKTINGFEREDGFDISAASELMAILALANNLQDLRKRIGRVVLAYNQHGLPLTADDFSVAGAMTVTMKDSIEPTLMQTLEGVPTLIHAGPFANIAHGNSSIIADKIALKLSDFVVTEGGFGSDMGFEKACNIKVKASNKKPDCAVVVATLRGLKANSGLYDLRPGNPLPDSIFSDDQDALIAGFENLKWHINNVKQYGVSIVIAINRFPQDSIQELNALKQMIIDFDPSVRVEISEAFGKGGEGATQLAHAVVKACQDNNEFKPLYQSEQSLEEKLMAVAEVGYGASSITLSALAKQQLEEFNKHGFNGLSVCLAKTPLSISTEAHIKGAPAHFDVPVRELKLCAGAGFIYALCGNVMTMPGLPDKPAFMSLDIDDKGDIIGLS